MKMSQTQMVKLHLENYGNITPGEARIEYASMRLSSIIHRLRRVMRIRTKIIRHKNRFGHNISYALYEVIK